MQQSTTIEGYFYKSRSTFIWILLLSVAIIGGGIGAVIALMNSRILLAGFAILPVCIIGGTVFWQRRRGRVRVRYSENRLTIRGAGHHITLPLPFDYRGGIQLIAHGRRKSSHRYYLRLVLDVYGRPFVLEEQIPKNAQLPDIPPIDSNKTADLSSSNRYPGTLWMIFQELERVNTARKQREQGIQTLLHEGQNQLEARDYYAAIQTFSELIRLSSNSPELYYRRGFARYHAGQDMHAAINDLTTVLRLQPDYQMAFIIRGLARSRLGDWSGMVEDCSYSLQLKPDDSHALNLRGSARFQLKDYEGAMMDYNQAIQIDTKNAEAYHSRGILKHALGNRIGAIADYDKALRLQPGMTEAKDNRDRSVDEKRRF